MSSFVNYVEGTAVTPDKLRNAYFECINAVQKYKFHFHNEVTEEIFLDFNQDDHMTQENSNFILCGLPELREEHEFTEDEINIIKHNMKMSHMMLNNYDPEVSNIIPMLTGCFVFAKDMEIGAASRSDCLGVTFLNPQPDWQLQDYAECILHQSVHQSIFLDDMINVNIFIFASGNG